MFADNYDQLPNVFNGIHDSLWKETQVHVVPDSKVDPSILHSQQSDQFRWIFITKKIIIEIETKI